MPFIKGQTAHNKTHGHARTANGKQSMLYQRWSQMKQRALNPHHERSADYSRRGITICKAWQDFQAFLADMGEPPSKNYTLDRIDNDGNYSCGHCDECLEHGWAMNCRWADYRTQAKNTRQVKLITINDETKAIAQWCRDNNIMYALVKQRRKRGWSLEAAISTPPIARKIKHTGWKGRAVTKEQALEIRRRFDRGESPTTMAAEYGVTSGAIRLIGNRKTWKHLPEENE